MITLPRTEDWVKKTLESNWPDLLIEREREETKELNEKTNKVEKSEEASDIIKKYEYIICT